MKPRDVTKVIDAYHRGALDRMDGHPPKPPKRGLGRIAYINGYNGTVDRLFPPPPNVREQ